MALGTEPPTGSDPQNVHYSFPCTQMQKAIEFQIIFSFLITWKNTLFNSQSDLQCLGKSHAPPLALQKTLRSPVEHLDLEFP